MTKWYCLTALAFVGVVFLAGWSGNRSLAKAEEMCVGSGGLEDYVYITHGADLAICKDGRTKTLKW